MKLAVALFVLSDLALVTDYIVIVQKSWVATAARYDMVERILVRPILAWTRVLQRYIAWRARRWAAREG